MYSFPKAASLLCYLYCLFEVAYGGGGGWGFNPPSLEIPKAVQNRAKLNLIVKTVKNC